MSIEISRNKIHLLFCTLLMILSSKSIALDSYENGILSIPKVVVGGNVYSNVKITVKEILSIKGGKPVADFDIFNAAKNQLLIPEVTYAGKKYFNVSIVPDQILAVEKAWSRIGFNQKLEFGTFDLKIDTGLYLNNIENDDVMFDIIAIGDVNMDGYDDLLIGIMRLSNKGGSVNRTVKPLLLIFNPSTNKYEVNQEFAKLTTSHVYPRQGSIVDLDGDGRNDIFIGDTGVDGGSYDCGNKNSIVLNKSTGMVNATSLLPNVNDYSHGLIVNDFNQDKKNDLLIINMPWINKSTCNVSGEVYRNRSYMLSGGTFNELSVQLTTSDSVSLGFTENSTTDAITVGGAIDLNNDGYLDIALGGNYGMYILESTGNLKFNQGIQVPPPTTYYNSLDPKNCLILNMFSATKCLTPYSYVVPFDFDGDGQLEILASLLNQTKDGSWRGLYFQVMKKTKKGWSDVTPDVFPEQKQDQSNAELWCYRIQFIDINNDGQLDILCTNYKSTVWINQDGKFYDRTSSFLESDKQRSSIVKFPDGNYLLRFEGWYQGSPEKFNITATLVN